MWDSNPRGVAPKRFSRPPRYDRFDNPPDLALQRRFHRLLRSKKPRCVHNRKIISHISRNVKWFVALLLISGAFARKNRKNLLNLLRKSDRISPVEKD